MWEKTKIKRAKNAFKREKKFSLEHAHVLSGILKCPCCGSQMYGSVNRKKKKGSDEFYADMWYYICKNRKREVGHSCNYKTHIRQEVVNEQVEAILKAALKDADFTTNIFDKIGSNNNLEALTETLERLNTARTKEEAKKTKLLGKIMALDPSDDVYDDMFSTFQDMIHEITINIAQMDENIYKTEMAISNVHNNQYSAETAYKIMSSMIELIDCMPDEDERFVMNFLLDSVQLYKERQPNGLWVKSVRFKIPINIDGTYYDEIFTDTTNSLPSEEHDETVCLLSKKASA